MSTDALADLIDRVRRHYCSPGNDDVYQVTVLAEQLNARLAEVEAERDAAKEELAVARSVVEAADAWRGENNGKGLVLPPPPDRIDALIAAVDLHRSIRNLDSAVPEPSFATETLPTTGGKP